MTNVNLLKSKMTAVGDVNHIQILADILNCSRSTASRKLNGEIQFTQGEIKIITSRYNLTPDDIKEIFIGDE